MKYLLVLILVFMQLPSHAVACNRLAKRYLFKLNTGLGPVGYTIRIVSKITNTEYSVNAVDNVGNAYNGQVFKYCNRFLTSLPVAVAIDGQIVQLDYDCTGAIRKNSSIAGGCSLVDPSNGLTVDSGGFNGSPIGSEKFRQLQHVEFVAEPTRE